MDDHPDEREEQPAGETVLEYLPSWLVSLVMHLVLVLLMALFTVAGQGGSGGEGVLLNASGSSSDSGPGDDELLAAALETPSELSASQLLETQTPEFVELSVPTDVATDINLVDPAQLVDPLDVADQTGGTADSGEGGEVGGGRGAGRGTGDATPTAIFGLVDEGMDFVYVFDCSQSMNSTFQYKSEGRVVFSITPLIAAKAELVKSLGDLNVNNRFHILFYNHQMWLFDSGRNSRALVTATPENVQRATTFVNSVYGDGQTAHVPPLEAAIRMRPDVIFLLTDGEEKDDPTPDELGRLRRLNKGRAKINVIQFTYTPQVESKLEDLARENGGRHLYMNISQLAPGLSDLAQVPVTVQPAGPRPAGPLPPDEPVAPEDQVDPAVDEPEDFDPLEGKPPAGPQKRSVFRDRPMTKEPVTPTPADNP